MLFHDRRTGQVIEFPQPTGYRNIMGADGPQDVTDPWDAKASPDVGDHVARPELASDPSYIKMMSKAGYAKGK